MNYINKVMLLAKRFFVGILVFCTFFFVGCKNTENSIPTENSMSTESSIAIKPTIVSTNYYISPQGNDENTGISKDSAWKNIQKAVDLAQPGDIIYLTNGVYNQIVNFTKSGLESAYITLQGYPDEVAVLDGTGLDAFGGMITINNQNYIKIMNLEICNSKTTQKDNTIAGIEISGSSHDVEICNNKIHNIENHAPVDNEKMGRDAHGISVYGTNSLQPIHNLVIDGNEIANCILGSSEALVLNGNVENFSVTNNLVHNNDNIGIDFIGFEGTADSKNDQVRNGVCSGNTVHDIDTYNNPSYGKERSAGGIYCDGSKNIVIENNTVYASNFGIEIASEHRGKSTCDITVQNNLVYNCHNAGLIMGGYDTKRGSAIGNKILNNKFDSNDTLRGGYGELCIQYDTKNNIIENNIFYSNNENLFISNAYEKNTENGVDNNQYYAVAGETPCKWQWKNKDYIDFDEYKSATENDVKSKLIFANK